MNKKIFDKIKKSLRLAQSSNTHEAAAAMRQAQKLMQAHGISDTDVRLSDVASASSKASASKNPPKHLHQLAAMIGVIFGVEPVFEVAGIPDRWETRVRFIGIESGPELAAYAFQVLRRQLTADRTAYRATLKRMKASTKTRRADLFALAWVRAVRSKVQALVVSDESKALIQQWKAAEYGESLEDAKAREHKFQNRDFGAALAGHEAGRKAQLHHGVAGTDRHALTQG